MNSKDDIVRAQLLELLESVKIQSAYRMYQYTIGHGYDALAYWLQEHHYDTEEVDQATYAKLVAEVGMLLLNRSQLYVVAHMHGYAVSRTWSKWRLVDKLTELDVDTRLAILEDYGYGAID